MTRQIFFIEDDGKINDLQVNELKKYLESCGYTEESPENNDSGSKKEETEKADIITTYTCSEDIIKVHQITVKTYDEIKGDEIISNIKNSVGKEEICVVVVDLCLNGNQTTGKELAVKIANCIENVKVQIVSSRLFSLSVADREEINKKNIIFFCRPVVKSGDEWIFNDKETTMFTAEKKLKSIGIIITAPDNLDFGKKDIINLQKKAIESVKSFNRKEQFFGCILAAVLF